MPTADPDETMHIRRPRTNSSWCGHYLGDGIEPAFESLAHATELIGLGTRARPCPACLLLVPGAPSSRRS